MGLYEHSEVGIWFESKEPMSYIQKMLPRGACVAGAETKTPNLYFVKCFEISITENQDKDFSDLENFTLRRLWKHLEQTQGFEPRRFVRIVRKSSTYSDQVITRREQEFTLE